jgi:hypothetical protein
MRSRAFILVAVVGFALALSSGCGGDEGGGDSATPSSYLSDLGMVQCQRALECCTEPELLDRYTSAR